MGWLEHGFSPTLISIPHFLSLINIPFLPVQQPRLAQHLSEQGGRWYPGWGRGCGSTGASQRKTWSCCDPPQQNQNALKSKKSAMLGFTGTSEGCWREMKPRASLRRPGETGMQGYGQTSILEQSLWCWGSQPAPISCPVILEGCTNLGGDGPGFWGGFWAF